jgi:hypothetical protein
VLLEFEPAVRNECELGNLPSVTFLEYFRHFLCAPLFGDSAHGILREISHHTPATAWNVHAGIHVQTFGTNGLGYFAFYISVAFLWFGKTMQ